MRDVDSGDVCLIGQARQAAAAERQAAWSPEPSPGSPRSDARPERRFAVHAGGAVDDPLSRWPAVPAAAFPDRPGRDGTVDDRCDDRKPGSTGPLRSEIPIVRPPRRDDAPTPPSKWNGRRRLAAAALVSCILVAAAGWRLTSVSDACRPSDVQRVGPADRLAAETVARQIVMAESGGNATARNARSSATGAGQFLDATWLDMIRAYRPDLTHRSTAEILDLRRDPDLSREMVGRFAEQNADMLLTRCLPVTPGTLYLSHFAGGAGAVAVLSAPEHADAATTMAMADSRGRTTREMIVTANPFLRRFTVADLKQWADRKMQAPRQKRLTEDGRRRQRADVIR